MTTLIGRKRPLAGRLTDVESSNETAYGRCDLVHPATRLVELQLL